MGKTFINGQVVDVQAKAIATKIKDKEVTLQMCYVDENEKDATTFEFAPIKGNKEYKSIAVKSGNRVSVSLIKGEQVVFSNISAQGLFLVLEAAFNQSKSTSNSLYVAANPLRKKASKSVASIVVEGAGVL
jgi:hypothetical protein